MLVLTTESKLCQDEAVVRFTVQYYPRNVHVLIDLLVRRLGYRDPCKMKSSAFSNYVLSLPSSQTTEVCHLATRLQHEESKAGPAHFLYLATIHQRL